jgi:very-short-patch-repair endonuclease
MASSRAAPDIAEVVRPNHILLLGWQVLRFTWRDLTEQPARVIAEIRAAVAAR